MSSERKDISGALVLMLTVFIGILIVDYAYHNDLILPKTYSTVFEVYYKIAKTTTDFRLHLSLLVILLTGLSAYLTPSVKFSRDITTDKRIRFSMIALVLSLFFAYGYWNIPFYDIFIYPFVFVFSIYFISKAISFFRGNFVEEDIFGINKKVGKHTVWLTVIVKLKPKKIFDKLAVTNANQHILVEGGSGSGKSASIIKPLIMDYTKTGLPGVIYDYNGDPRDEGSPILSRTAYRGLSECSVKDKAKLALINFTDMSMTMRVNVLSEKYIREKADISNMCITLMKNLEPAWKQKTDFWAQNAISFVEAVTLMYYKYYKEYCTLPHVLATCMHEHPPVLEWIVDKGDSEILHKCQPIITAYRQQAEGQIAGAISSAQLPLAKLDSAEIFWVLSADEFSLDITKNDNKSVLCLANAPSISEYVTPVLAVILNAVMTVMNTPGKSPAFFVVDELPTINIFKLDNFVSVVRKYGIACILAYQSFSQMIRDYGKDNANTIRDASGNFFFGSTGSLETAKYVSDFIGDTKKIDRSYSESPDHISASERMSREKILQPRDIMSQPIGHFVGKVVDGEPPLFSLQFNPYLDEENEKDIPRFSLPEVTKDKKKNMEILNNMVRKNYEKINQDVKSILADYIVQEEPEEEESTDA
jgi:type IV secretory pathway TraG/TraD family ATPase VirD4